MAHEPTRGVTRILHLEDNPQDAELVRAQLARELPNCDIRCVASEPAFIAELQRGHFDVILSDFALQSFNGMEALKLAREQAPGAPFIFLSGTIGEDRAIEAMRLGADDYVLKDRMRRLVPAITRVLREREERRKRQQAERRSRELSEFINQAREAIVVSDLAGRITFWNHGAEFITGQKAANVVDRRMPEVFDPETVLHLTRACEAATASGEWAGELKLPDATGGQRVIDLRITLIRDEAGAPVARLALGTDITDRRVAERRIREQAEMLNQASEGIFITDLLERVIYWNAGAARLFGWKPEEAIGKRSTEVIDPMLGSAMAAAAEETLRTGHWSGELRMYNRRRELIIVESRQSLIRDESGNPKARLCINTDITNRRRLEEQFLRAQRMENIGLLAAGIAHDLNNMLAPILLAVPMLREHVSEPGALSLLGTLEKSAERGANLVRQILAFAHGASGDQRLLQVRHLMREIASVITGTFPKSIRLEDHIPSDLWPINGNPTQIHQVLLNLCVNARDAMPNGGALRLRAFNRVIDRAGAAMIEGGRPGSFLVLEVEDTGSGIPPDVLKHMWEPFFTTKESGKGTGLGLSTVRGIIENHDGFIEVFTAAGQGSTFRIYLPAAESGVADKGAQPPVALREGKGELILVVDDEKHIREMTQTILTRHGYRVLLAADGAEAASVFAQRAAEIRLVITDLHMPNLDGAMLARALRRINPAVRTLAVSGLSSALGSRAEYKPEEFADGFLHKPFRAEALLSKVAEVLRGAPSPGSMPPWSPKT